MSIAFIDEANLSDFSGKRILFRADLNLPMTDDKINDDARLRAVLESLKLLKKAGARIIVLSHMGRPKGKRDESLSLLPVRDEMERQLGCEVAFADDCIGEEARLISENLQNGEVALLENLRFHSEEESNDEEFAKSLAGLAGEGGIYVNDAFSVSHRAHASVEAITNFFPNKCYGGLCLGGELKTMDRVLSADSKPLILVIGGSKISTKIKVIENMIDKLDYLIIGGGMANTFLLAKGFDVGKSLVEKDYCEVARGILSMARDRGVEVILPSDVMVSDSLENGSGAVAKSVADVSGGDMILDIGAGTVASIGEVFKSMDGGVVLWNGPLGAFEHEPFGEGTFECMRSLGHRRGGESIAGGGDTVYAAKLAGAIDNFFSYVSLAGGAFLEYLEGAELPGILALSKN